MARSSLNRKVTINTGSITVSLPADTLGNVSETTFSRNTDFAIPVNAVRVWIKNLGASNNSVHAAITVNGDDVQPGESAFIRTAFRDTSTSPAVLKRLPAYNIVTNGAWVEAVAEYL